VGVVRRKNVRRKGQWRRNSQEQCPSGSRKKAVTRRKAGSRKKAGRKGGAGHGDVAERGESPNHRGRKRSSGNRKNQQKKSWKGHWALRRRRGVWRERNRRAKREEVPSKKGRLARPERNKLEQGPIRWSQAPAPDLPAERPVSVLPSAPRPRELDHPVFLSAAEPLIDPELPVDIKPWEALIADEPEDGILYNTVVVRGHRSQRSRLYDAADNVYERGESVAIEADGARVWSFYPIVGCCTAVGCRVWFVVLGLRI